MQIPSAAPSRALNRHHAQFIRSHSVWQVAREVSRFGSATPQVWRQYRNDAPARDNNQLSCPNGQALGPLVIYI